MATRPIIGPVISLALFLNLSCGGGSSNGNNFVSQTPSAPNPPQTQVQLTRISSDSFSNAPGQHASEVEPHAFAFGSTIVAAFQVGRISAGGGVAVGFATSTNGGISWTNGSLAGLTTSFQSGLASAASDAVVAYDAAHGQWLISTLAIASSIRVAVSRSRDGIAWDNPIFVSNTPNADKNWIVCDNTATSPHFGNCYQIWDDPSQSGLIFISTSSDGGATWSAAQTTLNSAKGIGVVPVVQPNGNVIVPYLEFATQANPAPHQVAFRSTDGGTTWSTTALISNVTDHAEAGNLRSTALPTAQADNTGKLYVLWQDCRFRNACGSNDIVMSTSLDGLVWTSPVRIPLDAATSTADHFLPALAIDPSTGGTSAHLAFVYYSYSDANCTTNTCSLNAGFVTSQDGGASWTTPVTLVSGMLLSSLPNTTSGVMVGDYFATVFSGGKVFPIFALANVPNGSTLDQAMYTTASGQAVLASSRAFVTQAERAIPNAVSDHPPLRYYDLDREHPMKQPPLRKLVRRR
jgi:hypothetical protein